MKFENRYPFATQSGFIGFSSRRTQPQIGDIICWLSGGLHLFILRKEAEDYSFVGPCYLHGFMDPDV
jgi:hypothetical protein